jgi:ATP phosphoribosyltransferase regulatory subunit HisZ
MTQNKIIEMAKQVGMIYREISDEFANGNTDGVDLETMERFARLVAEHERNEIIEILDASTGYVHMDAIRERGQA